MKKITSILSVIALTALFSTSALAQQTSSATAESTTEIITPISITKNVDLSFGVFSTDGTVGSIALTAAAAAVTTSSNGIKITKLKTPSAAKFTVNGDTNYTYTMTVPETITLTGTTVAANTLTIKDFTSSLSTLSGGVLASGSQVIYVGGTLVVPATSKKDIYTNTTGLVVTVNYN